MAKTEAPRIDDVGHPPPGTKELAEIAPLLVPRSKRRWWRWCLGVVVLGSALVLLGACRMDAHARRLLAAEREAGIEPGVVRPGWGPIDAGPLDAEVAVLLIHGFRSTPRDFGELPDRLAGEGVRVRAMLLPGHGTSSEELATTTVEQWIEAVREEYRALRSRHASVRVVGYSLGGALALVALADEPPDRLALVAPYFAVAPRWYAWPDVETWARAARRLVDWIDSGPEVHGLRDRTHAADFPCYRVLPLDAVLRSFEVARRADDPELLGACTAPVLVLVPSHDTVADPEAMREAHAALGSADKRLETFDDSDHLLFWDRDAEQALHTIVPFLTAP